MVSYICHSSWGKKHFLHLHLLCRGLIKVTGNELGLLSRTQLDSYCLIKSNNIQWEKDYLRAALQVNRLCCLHDSQRSDLTRGPSYRLDLDSNRCRSHRGQLRPARFAAESLLDVLNHGGNGSMIQLYDTALEALCGS